MDGDIEETHMPDGCSIFYFMTAIVQYNTIKILTVVFRFIVDLVMMGTAVGYACF